MNKIQNTHHAEYLNNAHLCSEIVKKWNKIKPENEEIKAVMTALGEMSFYVARLHHDAQARDKVLQEYKLERNKWCKRAMDAKHRYDNVKKLEGI